MQNLLGLFPAHSLWIRLVLCTWYWSTVGNVHPQSGGAASVSAVRMSACALLISRSPSAAPFDTLYI